MAAVADAAAATLLSCDVVVALLGAIASADEDDIFDESTNDESSWLFVVWLLIAEVVLLDDVVDLGDD